MDGQLGANSVRPGKKPKARENGSTETQNREKTGLPANPLSLRTRQEFNGTNESHGNGVRPTSHSQWALGEIERRKGGSLNKGEGNLQTRTAPENEVAETLSTGEC